MRYKIILILFVCVFFACRQNETVSVENHPSVVSFNGSTMGTTYQIKYLDYQERDLKRKIDSILIHINDEVSTYIPSSTISQFNQKDTVIELSTFHHFKKNFEISQKVFQQSEGYFDPTVMPLVNYWGFGYKGKEAVANIDSNKINLILQSIGMNNIKIQESEGQISISKLNKDLELDFSAVAKGYAVDYIGSYLVAQGIENFLVEIGGENVAKGKNQKGQVWTIGINTPKEGAPIDDMIMAVRLEDKAIATSGDYRQFYLFDGKKFSHEIDPKTGYPKVNPLVSVSVIAPTCAEADAWATAFIVMGIEKSKALIENIADTEACFIITNEETEYEKIYSSGFSTYTLD